ncbi:hypothetical protein EDD22DRAFT_515030 [Suillus occidentalis]|nr:hypothetical protein EDD22DRAFT_515030 [Suillus occidentalis]
MFARIAALATFAVPLVSALTLNTPTGVSTGGVVNITWEATTADPSSFSLYMVNTIFHNTFAIANNVQASAGMITLTLPQVPVGDGYTIEATSNSNINSIYAQSGDFAVSAMTTASTSSDVHHVHVHELHGYPRHGVDRDPCNFRFCSGIKQLVCICHTFGHQQQWCCIAQDQPWAQLPSSYSLPQLAQLSCSNLASLNHKILLSLPESYI